MPFFPRLAVLAAVTLLAACAGKPSVTDLPPEQAAEARAQARWQALLASDWNAAYSMLTPGIRSATTLEQYRQGMLNKQVNWTGAAVNETHCDSPEKCTVSVVIDYSVRTGMAGVPVMTSVSTVQEVWLKLGGDWFHMPSGGLR